MLEKRINDRAFIRLIQKWLRAGILHPDGSVEYPEEKTAQGSSISPVLSNIYLQYVLDQWFEQKVKSTGQGKAILLRYADDFVAAFRFYTEAVEFMRLLTERFAEFGLELAKEKTKKLRFNRFRREESEPFEFLGFEFRWMLSRKGKDSIRLRTSRKKIRKIALAFKQWCKEVRNKRIAWIMARVIAKLRGLKNYFGVIGNSASLQAIGLIFERTLYKWLNRRSERKSYNWKTYAQMLRFFKVEDAKKLKKDGVQLSLLRSLV
jgi:RNA-directed DNA polymerase